MQAAADERLRRRSSRLHLLQNPCVHQRQLLDAQRNLAASEAEELAAREERDKHKQSIPSPSSEGGQALLTATKTFELLSVAKADLVKSDPLDKLLLMEYIKTLEFLINEKSMEALRARAEEQQAQSERLEQALIKATRAKCAAARRVDELQNRSRLLELATAAAPEHRCCDVFNSLQL